MFRINKGRLNQTAATTTVGIAAAIIGYGLLWFTNAANNFHHGWGYLWYIAFLLVAFCGLVAVLIEGALFEWVSMLLGGVGGAILTFFAIDRPIDDKLLSWTLGGFWSYLALLALTAVGVWFYRAISNEEAICPNDWWHFALIAIIVEVIAATLLGTFLGLLGIQAVLPTPGW